MADDAGTGRHVLVLNDALLNDVEAAREAVRALTGARTVVSTRDAVGGALTAEQLRTAEAVLFADLGVAVVAGADGDIGIRDVADLVDERIVAVEPERRLHAIAEPVTLQQDGPFADTGEATWGLQATGVATATASGGGVTVAVLDTGLDAGHPDFAGREVEARSFVDGQAAQDGQGHGTHCTGTATGPLAPEAGPRYGVAHGARVLVGKVLSDEGTGTDADILAGISWAVAAGASVISMSLGADQREVSTAYETVGRRALAAGTLIIAAAGNNARRSAGDPGFVGVPANSPSIMAIGALDRTLAVADFSASATAVDGGEIDIAAPGVEVYSSWPMPQRYQTISGTSMATPHVAGIAALWSEITGARGRALWDAVIAGAHVLRRQRQGPGAGDHGVPQGP
ncbi:MAG TPA: S8 family serine peptidase, partial [Pseudonocardia sp.]|nr:S8 family serine peptidase [Pseudonocardia sp.]